MKTTHTSGQLIRFLQLLDEQGVTPDLFQDRLSSGAFADVLNPSARIERPAHRAALGLPGLGIEAFPGATLTPFGALEFDASKPLPEHIAAGRYDWVNDDITAERFPLEGEGVRRLEAAVFHFGVDKSSEAVVSAAGGIDAANPWRVAGIGALCAFGAKHSEEQRKHPIVALGSVGEVRGARCVPRLHRDDAGRRLNLSAWVGAWTGHYRFLLVRNASK
jgi:hypothetical protein